MHRVMERFPSGTTTTSARATSRVIRDHLRPVIGRTTRCAGFRGGPDADREHRRVVASVTVGSEAMAPCPKVVPASSAAPHWALAASGLRSYARSVAAVPQKPTTCCGGGNGGVDDVVEHRSVGAFEPASHHASTVEPHPRVAGPVEAPHSANAGPRDDEGCPRLHDVQRAVSPR